MGLFGKKKKHTRENDDQNVDRSQKYNLIREAENQRYLDELLSRKRVASVQERILAVIKYEKDILKKISIIEKVDARGVETLSLHERRIKVLTQKKSSNRNDSRYRFESPSQRGLGMPVVMPTATPNSFFKYFLREWRAISHFGKSNALLKGSLLKRRHELTDDFLHYWNVELKVILNFIDEPVQLLVAEGWQSLDLMQHNLVVVLRNMIKVFKDQQLLILETRVTRKVYMPIVPFFEYYLQLIQRAEYKNILLDGMLNYLKDVRSFSPVLRRILSATASLFDVRKNGPSLQNCLLALDMAYYRKNIELENALRRFHVDPISNKHYICDTTIKERIEQFIKSRVAELDEIEGNLAFLDSMGIRNAGDMESNVYAALFSLYAGQIKPPTEDGRTPAVSGKRLLQYDMVSFVSKAAENFVTLTRQFLSGEVQLAGIEIGKRLYNEVVFAKDIDNLSERLYVLRDLKGSHDRLTMNLDFFRNYVARTTPDGTYTEVERRYCQIFREMGTAFYQIALKINHLLSHAVQTSDGQEDSNYEVAREANTVPFATAKVVKPSFYDGLSVHDVLCLILEHCIAFSILLEESSLKALAKRRLIMEERAQDIKKDLQRMK